MIDQQQAVDQYLDGFRRSDLFTFRDGLIAQVDSYVVALP